MQRRADPADGRRAVMSVTESGLQALRSRRQQRVRQLARALATDFTPAERQQLMTAAPLLERLAQSM